MEYRNSGEFYMTEFRKRFSLCFILMGIGFVMLILTWDSNRYQIQYYLPFPFWIVAVITAWIPYKRKETDEKRN